jgi:DHA1 family inner membrane transport protein
MSTQRDAMSRGRANLVLATLFLGMFVLGTAELLVVGVLNVIAADMQVSIPAAGASVTGYALGLAIGGPLLAALTIRLDKRIVLAGALLLFVLANLVTVLTSSYALFLAARVATGAFQGLFIAAAFGVGISVVAPERMGRAISVVVSGVTVSAALGVPLGTLVGQLLGWRGSFVAIIAVSVVALVATLALVPSVPSTGAGAGSQARYAFAPRVLAVLVLHILVFAAIYTALTYIVPFLETVTGVSGAWISVFLLAYGVATAVGSMSGGRFADRNAARTLIAGSIGVTAALAVLHLMGAFVLLAAVAVLAMGLFGMGMAPSLQYRVVSLAGPGGALAQSLPASAVNVGIAVGSYAGGVAIERATASSVVLPGLVIAALAVVVAVATRKLAPPVVEAAEPAATGSLDR